MDDVHDPTCGHDETALRAIRPPPEPPEWTAFWRATRGEASSVPADAVVEADPRSHHSHRVRRVRFSVLGGLRTGAWLLEPREGVPVRGVIVGHGYGGRDDLATFRLPRDAVALLPCAPGFALSAAPDLPDTADLHVLHGIGDRATYLIRTCVAQVWAAADVLLALHPGIAGRLQYHGQSFGGGLGALALPWDDRFSGAFLDVPTFGHHPLRRRCPCLGSGAAVNRWLARHPEAMEVLAYYDAAVAAARIAVPVVCSPAFADPVVPPPGQWAVANALPRGVIVPQSVGHGENPHGLAEWRRILAAVRDLP